MTKKPTLFFDSGVGGIPYLEYIRNIFHSENFIYLADNINFPYGEKNPEFLISVITKALGEIIRKFEPKAIVIACNTASVTALKHIREMTDIPVVGVVPAIKTASEITGNNRIGILATKRTVEGDYLKGLINEFCPNRDVFTVGASEIVTFVEDKLYNLEREDIELFINQQVEFLIRNDVDCVVLGCTHFIHVSEYIKMAFGENVNIIDSREGVINQVLRVAEYEDQNSCSGYAWFFHSGQITGKEKDRYDYFCSKYKMEYKGVFL